MNIFAIGDSHADFFAQVGLLKSHWLGPLHIATMYKLLEHKPNLSNLREDLIVSDHYRNIGVPAWKSDDAGIYNTPNINPGDLVIFSFGYNDVQKNIHKHAAANWQSEISGLVERYLLLLKYYESAHGIKCVPCSIPPNPSVAESGATGQFSYGINGDFSTSGTSGEREMYTKYANNILAESCPRYTLPFLNIYDTIVDDYGFINKCYTEDFVHLHKDKSADIIQKIEDAVRSITIIQD